MDLISLCQDNKRACDNCRLRKVKCDFEAESCSSCIKRGVQCTFLEKPKPRGRRKKHSTTSSQQSPQQQRQSQEPMLTDRLYVKDYEDCGPSASTTKQIETLVSDPTIPHFRDIEQYSLKRSSSTTKQPSPITSSQSADRFSPFLY